MEAQMIETVISLAFGGKGSTRSRLFVTCITQEQVLIILDGQRHSNPETETYTNVFVPTICGKCCGIPGSRIGTRGDFEVSDKILRRTAAFKAIQRWCGTEPEVVRHVADRDVIMRECKKYKVHFQGAEVVDGGLDGDLLQIMPYYDPSFA